MKTISVALVLTLLLSVVVSQAGAQTRAGVKPTPASGKAAAPKYPLSEERARVIRKLIAENKLKSVPLALRVADAAKAFDDDILSETPSAESEQKARQAITDALDEATALRLQTIRDVVALLTPEQKGLLKEEMSKPGASPSGLLETLQRVFKLPE